MNKVKIYLLGILSLLAYTIHAQTPKVWIEYDKANTIPGNQITFYAQHLYTGTNPSFEWTVFYAGNPAPSTFGETLSLEFPCCWDVEALVPMEIKLKMELEGQTYEDSKLFHPHENGGETCTYLCQATLPISTADELAFSYQTGTGLIQLEQTDGACAGPQKVLMPCIRQNISTIEVIASQATLLSDRWEEDYNTHNPSEGYNPYETGQRGNWRAVSSYAYKTALSDKALTYQAGTFPLAMFSWNVADKYRPATWLSPAQVTAYSQNGEALSEVNALGIESIVKFGYGGNVPYLSAQNSPENTTFFESFENQYQINGQSYFEDGFLYDESSIELKTDADKAHSGSKYISFKNGITHFDLKPMPLTKQIKENKVLVKLWASPTLSSEAPVPGQEIPENLLSINIEGTEISQTMQIVAQVGKWFLCEAYLDVSSLQIGTELKIQIQHNQVWQAINLDDIRVQPADAVMGVYVYEPGTLKLLASFDDQHFGLYNQYNSEGKLTAKLIETVKGKRLVQETQYNIPQKNK